MILTVYLILCTIIFISCVGMGLYEDLFGKPDAKFGPNYKSAMFWIFTTAISCPIINVLLVMQIAFNEIVHRREMRNYE